MDGFVLLVRDMLIENGISGVNVYSKKMVELPGYFRPEKRWDLLVVIDEQLLATIEFKSQVGPSFGNNFNNRTEELSAVLQTFLLPTGKGRSSSRRVRGSAIYSSLKRVPVPLRLSELPSHTFRSSPSFKTRPMPNAMRFS